MSPTLELLRSIELDDLLELDLESLQRLTTLCTSAIVQTSSHQAEEHHAKKQRVEEASRTELLLREPTINELYATQPVKLNVGGTYFATSLENLLREEGSFFAAQFGGRWVPKVNPKDDAVFIDRDPTHFAMILNYLRTGTIKLDKLHADDLQLLNVEADFYQLSSLLAMLPRPKFSTEKCGQVELSELDSIATNKQAGDASLVRSLTPFSPNVMEMSIEVLAGQDMFIGVAPRNIMEKGRYWQNCGWFMDACTGTLYGSDGKEEAEYGLEISPGSIVTVKFDVEFNIRFVVNGKDWGVAFSKVANDFATTPLFLCVQFNYPLDDKAKVWEGAVQMLRTERGQL